MIPLDPPLRVTFISETDLGVGRTVKYAFDGAKGVALHEGPTCGVIAYKVATTERPVTHADAMCLHGWEHAGTGDEARGVWDEIRARAGR